MEYDLGVLSTIRKLLLFDILVFSTYFLLEILLAIDSPLYWSWLGSLFLITFTFQITFVAFYASRSEILSTSNPLVLRAGRLIIPIALFPLISLLLTTIGLHLVIVRHSGNAGPGFGTPIFITGLSGCFLSILVAVYLFADHLRESTSLWFKAVAHQRWLHLEEEAARPSERVGEPEPDAESGRRQSTAEGAASEDSRMEQERVEEERMIDVKMTK